MNKLQDHMANVGGIIPRPEWKVIPMSNKERGWWWNVCDCCKWSWFARANSTICEQCIDHDRTKPCELLCQACGHPSHEHPVMTPTIHCSHKCVTVFNPNFR